MAESDAADPVVENDAPDEAPIEIELEEEGGAQQEADDLEDFEIEGRKVKIPKPIKELAEMGKDYRYKTGLTAAEKREAEAEKTKYSALVRQAEEAIKASQPPKPDPAMLDRMSEKYDPDTYHLQRANWEGWAQRAFDAEQERKRLEGEATTKAERERLERKSVSEREVLKAIPKWKDPAARAADRARMEQYLAAEGVDRDEMGELDNDHRLTKMAYKAMLYDEAVAKAKANKGEPKESTVHAMPVRKVGGGGGAGGGVPKTTEAYIAWRLKGGKM